MNKNIPKIIGIAGGTGSGKTTLAIELYKKHKNVSSLMHLDDYFKKSLEIPKLHGFVNYEDPTALRLDDLYNDLKLLKGGNPITVKTKSELFNPNYTRENPVKIDHVVEPKRFVLLEGYMVLYDQRIRDLLDLKIFLDIPLSDSSKRRSHTKDPVDSEYFEKVLEPMFKKIVEPTKEFADFVIDVSDKSIEELVAFIESKLSV